MSGSPAASLAVALGIGLMLGLERERHKGRGPDRGAAGIRTFALVALLGGLAERVGGAAVVAAGVAFVGLAAIAAYLRTPSDDPGLTTEVALVVAFMLGVLAQRDAGLAAGAGVAVAILLTARGRLHKLARDTLDEDEVHDGLLFAAAALIVLPLVPDEGMGPYDAFNPFVVWRLVVLVMAVNALGYIALRTVGPRLGLPLVGFIGGFVSSTATIGTMGARAVREPALRRGAVAAGVASTVATVVFLALVLGAIHGPTLGALALALVFAGLAAVAYATLFGLRAARAPEPDHIERGRAFDLRIAVTLALAISGLLVLATVLERELGDAGVVLAAAAAGFADAQSAGAAVASLAAEGRVDADHAAIAVLFAFVTNTVSKSVVALTMGRRGYAAQIWPGLLLVAGAAWLGLLVQRAL